MSYNWIKPEELSVHAFAMLDRWAIRMILDNYRQHEGFLNSVGDVFNHYPTIYWCWKHRAPEKADQIDQLASAGRVGLSRDELRQSEIKLIESMETTIVYMYPEIMETCDYIRQWDKKYLLELADFTDRKVLDIGAGTGRLTFAVHDKARYIYASEPTDMLRDYMRDKAAEKGIENITVVDGTIESLPFDDETFDIVMSGHVMGDDYEAEFKELNRVLRSGGLIIDCIGEDNGKRKVKQEMLDLGFEAFYHENAYGGQVYRYRYTKA